MRGPSPRTRANSLTFALTSVARNRSVWAAIATSSGPAFRFPEQGVRCWHWRLATAILHERHIGKAVKFGEPGIEGGLNRLQ